MTDVTITLSLGEARALCVEATAAVVTSTLEALCNGSSPTARSLALLRQRLIEASPILMAEAWERRLREVSRRAKTTLVAAMALRLTERAYRAECRVLGIETPAQRTRRERKEGH